MRIWAIGFGVDSIVGDTGWLNVGAVIARMGYWGISKLQGKSYFS